MKERLFVASQYVLPHHLISRLAGCLAECRLPWVKNTFIKWFVRHFQVDMREAQTEEPTAYEHFNAFFTRLFKDNLFVAPIRGLNLPWLADALTLTCSGFVTLVTAWLTWGALDFTDRRFALEFGLVLTALLLVMPPSPLYSFTWLLLPFLALMVSSMSTLAKALAVERPAISDPDSVRLQSKALAVLGLTALAYIIVARDYPYRIRFITRILQSHHLFGALLLWAVLAWLLWRRQGDERWGAEHAPDGSWEENCDR